MIRATPLVPKRQVRRHRDALRISSELTQIFRRMYRPKAMLIRPEKVIKLLNQAGVKFVLMGTHGVGGWRSEPRATQDVDVLVQKSHHRKAVKAIREAFPNLLVVDRAVVTRFVDPTTDKAVIDVMKPSQKVFQMVFRHTIEVGNHKIPDLEMALVSKYAAMISPNRQEEKKLVDAGDFMDVVKTHRDDIDFPKVERLGDVVYSGGGAEIVKYIQDILAGRRIEL